MTATEEHLSQLLAMAEAQEVMCPACGVTSPLLDCPAVLDKKDDTMEATITCPSCAHVRTVTMDRQGWKIGQACWLAPEPGTYGPWRDALVVSVVDGMPALLEHQLEALSPVADMRHEVPYWPDDPYFDKTVHHMTGEGCACGLASPYGKADYAARAEEFDLHAVRIQKGGTI